MANDWKNTLLSIPSYMLHLCAGSNEWEVLVVGSDHAAKKSLAVVALKV